MNTRKMKNLQDKLGFFIFFKYQDPILTQTARMALGKTKKRVQYKSQNDTTEAKVALRPNELVCRPVLTVLGPSLLALQ